MNSRQRFELAVKHQVPDRVPMDIGATSLTGMKPLCQQRLQDLLGFRDVPTLANNGIDERILQWAGTDFRSVGAIVALPNKHLGPDANASMDCWGIQRELIDGEYQITRYPLRGATIQGTTGIPMAGVACG